MRGFSPSSARKQGARACTKQPSPSRAVLPPPSIHTSRPVCTPTAAAADNKDKSPPFFNSLTFCANRSAALVFNPVVTTAVMTGRSLAARPYQEPAAVKGRARALTTEVIGGERGVGVLFCVWGKGGWGKVREFATHPTWCAHAQQWRPRAGRESGGTGREGGAVSRRERTGSRAIWGASGFFEVAVGGGDTGGWAWGERVFYLVVRPGVLGPGGRGEEEGARS